jgi:hypothetical protein
MDDDIALVNACADLVSLKKNEAFPARLLLGKRPGEWVRVWEFCRQLGVAFGELGTSVFATWLPDPRGDDGYAVILFYDDESGWSMTAHHNRALVARTASSQPIATCETGIS